MGRNGSPPGAAWAAGEAAKGSWGGLDVFRRALATRAAQCCETGCASEYALSRADDRRSFQAGHFRLRRGAGRQRANHQPSPCRGADGLRISDHGKSSRRALLRHERSGNARNHRARVGLRAACLLCRARRIDDRGRVSSIACTDRGGYRSARSLTLPICVASSSSVAQIRQKLGITGLLERFGEHLFSAAMVARGKPAPDLFLYAAQRLATVPDRCLVIEDSPAGIDAALAAGMTAIGFSGGSHCGPEHGGRLQKHGAALVMDDMLELTTAMAKLT